MNEYIIRVEKKGRTRQNVVLSLFFAFEAFFVLSWILWIYFWILSFFFFCHTFVCSTQFEPESTWFYINMWYDVQILKWNNNNKNNTHKQASKQANKQHTEIKLIMLKYKQNSTLRRRKTLSHESLRSYDVNFFSSLSFQCMGTSSAFCQCNGNNV